MIMHCIIKPLVACSMFYRCIINALSKKSKNTKESHCIIKLLHFGWDGGPRGAHTESLELFKLFTKSEELEELRTTAHTHRVPGAIQALHKK